MVSTVGTTKAKKIGKILYKILIAIVSIFVVVLFILGAYTAVSKYFLGNSMPKIFGYASAIVTSGSMEPEISVDDLVIVKSQNEEYKLGEIITYKSGNSYVTHRIIDIFDGLYTTKGDVNNTPDSPVSHDDIVGKVVGKVSGIGQVFAWFQTPIGISVALVIILLLVFSDTIFERIKRLFASKNNTIGK